MAINVECSVCDAEVLYQVLSQPSDKKTIVVDVRTKGEYKGSSIDGSVNMPLNEISKKSMELSAYDDVYIYCHNGMRTEEACSKLRLKGLNNITAVDGGIVGWRKAGYPVSSSKSSSSREMISLQRQVQITAGSTIILGYVLSLAVNPAFIYLSVLFGVGLLFTGISGSCMMAMVLAKMPWNK